MEIYLKFKGFEYIDVVYIYYNLGFVDNEMGEFEWVSEFYWWVLDVGFKKLGFKYVDVVIIYSGFGFVFCIWVIWKLLRFILNVFLKFI